MEEHDRSLILKLRSDNFLLGKLYAEHIEFEKRLARLENRPFLLPQEEEEARRLKREKLFGVDRMMQIIQKHKAHSNGDSRLAQNDRGAAA